MIKHPTNKFERLNILERKKKKLLRAAERESRVRAKLAREALKAQEAEDAIEKWPVSTTEEIQSSNHSGDIVIL